MADFIFLGFIAPILILIITFQLGIMAEKLEREKYVCGECRYYQGGKCGHPRNYYNNNEITDYFRKDFVRIKFVSEKFGCLFWQKMN